MVARQKSRPFSALYLVSLVVLVCYVGFLQSIIYRCQGKEGSSSLSSDVGFDQHSAVKSTTRKLAIPDQADTLDTDVNERRVGVFRHLPVKTPRPVPWQAFSDTTLKMHYPIFVTSLPKSGTTSIWKFFKCGGVKSSHNWVTKEGEAKSSLAGECIEDNIRSSRPPFEKCGEFDVFSDTGVSAVHSLLPDRLAVHRVRP